MIAFGADVNAHRSTSIGEGRDEKRTPLLAAWIMRNEEVMELLLNNGANELCVFFECVTTMIVYEGDYNHYVFDKKERWIGLAELMNEEK